MATQTTVIEEPESLITRKAFHILKGLTSLTPLPTFHTRIVKDIPRVPLETSETKIVLIAIETPQSTKIVKLWQIDISFYILSLQLNMTLVLDQFVPQSTS